MDITERKYRLIEKCMEISTVEEIERAEYFFNHEIEQPISGKIYLNR